MSAPDLSLLATQLSQLGGPIFGKAVVGWNLRNLGVQVRTNVKMPQALVKISAVGGPRPYRINEDFGDGVKMTNRLITAFQSKKDWLFDPEAFRNTLLADAPGAPFYEQCAGQVSKEYLAALVNSTLLTGVRDANGDGPEDVTDGWGTIIDKLIAGTDPYGDVIIPIVTGDIDATNAVAAVETMKRNAPTWMREWAEEVPIYCSFQVFDDYAANYRTLNGFQLQPRVTGDYKIDNCNMVLRPAAFMKTSKRLIMTPNGNLVVGTDAENVAIHATPNLNYLKIRNMMPLGCEIQDAEALFVNDQA